MHLTLVRNAGYNPEGRRGTGMDGVMRALVLAANQDPALQRGSRLRRQHVIVTARRRSSTKLKRRGKNRSRIG